jgi:hypothetical protein
MRESLKVLKRRVEDLEKKHGIKQPQVIVEMWVTDERLEEYMRDPESQKDRRIIVVPLPEQIAQYKETH